eukprot:2350996-Pleurochrysis_carterae.AAC.1
MPRDRSAREIRQLFPAPVPNAVCLVASSWLVCICRKRPKIGPLSACMPTSALLATHMRTPSNNVTMLGSNTETNSEVFVGVQGRPDAGDLLAEKCAKVGVS